MREVHEQEAAITARIDRRTILHSLSGELADQFVGRVERTEARLSVWKNCPSGATVDGNQSNCLNLSRGFRIATLGGGLGEHDHELESGKAAGWGSSDGNGFWSVRGEVRREGDESS